MHTPSFAWAAIATTLSLSLSAPLTAPAEIIPKLQTNPATLPAPPSFPAASRSASPFTQADTTPNDDVTIRANTVVTTGNFNGGFGDASGIFVRSNANGDLRNVTVVENTVFTSGDQAQAMHLFSNGGGSLSQVALLGNRIQPAGQHSVLVRTNNAAGRLCIAQFRDNISLSPGVFNPGANDLHFEVFGGSTVNFVDFAKVAVTNTGFGSISGSPTGQPGACP